jgi:hypothetical protein
MVARSTTACSDPSTPVGGRGGVWVGAPHTLYFPGPLNGGGGGVQERGLLTTCVGRRLTDVGMRLTELACN